MDGEPAAQKCVLAYAGEENMFWCFAHRLQLCVGKALEEFGFVICDTRDYLKTTRKSPYCHALNQAQSHIRPDSTPLRPLLDNNTRWSSTYTVLKCFLDLYPAIQYALQDQSLHFDIDPLQDALEVSCIVYTVLKPFATITTLTQRENYPSLGLVPFWIAQLNTQLETTENIMI